MAANQKPYTRAELESLIKEYMGIESITPMISKQISNLIIKYGMTFLEIARCLCWYVEEQNGSLQPMYGIGIVPNIREQAAKYFKQLELDQEKQQKAAEKVVEYQENNIIFNIKAMPHIKKAPKQFNISEVKIEEDVNN